MGYILLLVVGVAAFGALALLGAPRVLWTTLAAALVLGAIGYVWQGRPSLAGASARPNAVPGDTEPTLIELRGRMMGRFTADAAYFTMADAMLRSGDRDAAAKVMLGGVRALPRSYMLWTGLGTALAARDDDQVSPAALLAFRQAIRLAPNHPAPVFYLGLAYVRAGDPARGRLLWRRALEMSPPGVSYRRDIAELLMMLDQMSRMQQTR